jgi:hypothetical protein
MLHYESEGFNMADQERYNRTSSRGSVNDSTVDIHHRLPAPEYGEETAAEIAAPVTFNRHVTSNRIDSDRDTRTAGRGLGYVAIALSILSLFVVPILFGAAGIILGFIARRRGAEGLGSWAIGIGAISIIVGMFILPFF